MNWLDYFILIVSCTVELYLIYYFFGTFFEKRSFIKNRLMLCIVFILFVILLDLINLIGIATVNLWISPAIMFIYLLANFKMKLVQGVMYFIFVFSILIGCEYLFVVLAGITNGNSGETLSSMPWQTLSIQLMRFILILVIKQLFINKKERLTNKFFWMYLCLPIASLGMMFTTYFISLEVINLPHVKIALTFSYVFMLFGNIIVFTTFNRYAENLHHSLQQDWIITKEKMNKEYYHKITDTNEKWQTLIHDLRHYLIAVKGLIQTRDNDEALGLLSQLNTQLENNELRVYSKIPFLDVILTEKTLDVEKNNIQFNVYVEPDISFEKINKADYIVMLGNLLDNAIQAASQCISEAYVDVKIFTENRGTFLTSKVKNNFKVNSLIINGEEFVTTKKEAGAHGIGIKSVKKSAIRCGGTFLTEIEKDSFTAILILPVGGKDNREGE